MDSPLNIVRGNTSLQLKTFFQTESDPTVEPIVEVRFHVSIHQPSRIIQVESQPEVSGFLFPLCNLLAHRLRGLQIERMLSHIAHPHRSFWVEQISSYIFRAANAVLLERYSGLLVAVDLDIGEAEPPMIDEEFFFGYRRGFGAVPSITSLETKRFQGDGKYGTICAICLENFEAGEELVLMPCSHEFHQSCAAKWLEHNSVCPLCLYAIPTGDGENVIA